MDNNALKIFGRVDAFNVQKVMWLVDELNLSYTRIDAGGTFKGLDTPQFTAMNPHQRVPVISDNGHIVWESHSILRYLAAVYGKENFWSENPQERSKSEQWMDWAQTSLQIDFLTGVFWGYYRTPQAQRDWAKIELSIERCKAHFKLLDHMFDKHQFIISNTLTLADITIGTFLYRYFELDFPKDPLPKLKDYYERLKLRPAYKKNVMVSFEHMKGRLTF